MSLRNLPKYVCHLCSQVWYPLILITVDVSRLTPECSLFKNNSYIATTLVAVVSQLSKTIYGKACKGVGI